MLMKITDEIIQRIIYLRGQASSWSEIARDIFLLKRLGAVT